LSFAFCASEIVIANGSAKMKIVVHLAFFAATKMPLSYKYACKEVPESYF
jgi:hypothetical protein